MVQDTRTGTNGLRALAILLIINSHLDAYYPVAGLATGGMLGNALFFMLSGYGLAMSLTARPTDFGTYYWRRLSRIFPSVWVCLVLLKLPSLFLLDGFQYGQLFTYLGYFFWTPFWFLNALLVYYVVLYFFITNWSVARFRIGMAVLAGLYVLQYLLVLDLNSFTVESLPFKLTFYGMVMAFGVSVARGKSALNLRWYDPVLALFFVAAIYAQKAMFGMPLLRQLQFMQQLLVFPFLFYVFRTFQGGWVTAILTNRLLVPVLGFLGGATLEIYLAHGSLSRAVLSAGLPFPANALVFIALSMAGAWIIRTVANSEAGRRLVR